MTDIAFETTDRPAAFRIGEISLVYVVSLGLAGFLLLAGMNWVVANALHGLVAVLGGA